VDEVEQNTGDRDADLQQRRSLHQRVRASHWFAREQRRRGGRRVSSDGADERDLLAASEQNPSERELLSRQDETFEPNGLVNS
jgi:hypothetical protein